MKTLALRVAEVKAKTVSDTLEHVKAKTLVIKFAATVAEMKARTTRRTLLMFRSKHWWTRRLTRYKR